MNSQIVSYSILFFLTLLSSTTGNLKQVLLIKGKSWHKYIITMLDAAVYGFLLKSLATDKSIVGILIFIAGKTFSVLLSDILLNKLSKQVYLVNLYLDEDKLNDVMKFLYLNNFSCTYSTGKYKHKTRHTLSSHLTKKQINQLKEYLLTLGIINPTWDIIEVKVNGNIEKRLG